MTEILLAAAALLAAACLVLATVPVAISIAFRTRFLDRPVGYKAHAKPTPYLGGAPVVAASVVAFLCASGDPERLAPLAGVALVLWAVGTADDRVMLGVLPRLVATAGSAVVLWAYDLGWNLFASPLLDLALTIVWVIAIVNAFNLMDNMDGAAASVAAACGMGIGILALVEGDAVLATVPFALAGACAAFLRFNLSRPSRIFLGDGGSMPIGLLVATSIMALPTGHGMGWPALTIGVLLVGLPLLDTALVIVSRRRRGRPILLGSCDHLTHRLVGALGSARVVAFGLAAAQMALGATAILVSRLDGTTLAAGLFVLLAAAATIIAVLDSPAWAPPSVETGRSGAAPRHDALRVTGDR